MVSKSWVMSPNSGRFGTQPGGRRTWRTLDLLGWVRAIGGMGRLREFGGGREGKAEVKSSNAPEAKNVEAPEVWKIDPFTSVGPISAGMTEKNILEMFGPPDFTHTYVGALRHTWDATGLNVSFVVEDGVLFEVGGDEPKVLRFQLAGVDLAGSVKRAVDKLTVKGLEPVNDLFETWCCEGVRFGGDSGRSIRSITSTYLRLTRNDYPDDIWEYPWMRDQ
jgi:hypothetical protein